MDRSLFPSVDPVDCTSWCAGAYLGNLPATYAATTPSVGRDSPFYRGES